MLYPSRLFHRRQCCNRLCYHGPDGPPPDDGYEFEDDAEGGIFFGN